MHSLAIALKQGGHEVTGSDDHIYEPARGRLAALGLLPEAEGWFPDRIHSGLDAVILGMHAFEDNPELIRAREMGLPVFSFPEFIYEHARNKQRIVIGGSYGKTTITSMVMHVLQAAGVGFDYLVGAQVPGFDNPVRLSDSAAVLIAEGDEYFASRLDRRPKFLLYHPHIAVINGISWDHINVFPTELEYLEAFEKLIADMPKAGVIVYPEADGIVSSYVEAYDNDTRYTKPYKTPKYSVKDGRYVIHFKGKDWPVSVIGRHNMTNISAAYEVCRLLAIDHETFMTHIGTFKGASMRLEKVHESPELIVYRDYAHAPAKVKATVEAVREMYPKHNLIACAELHTFSSLNREYLSNYYGSMKEANRGIVFVSADALAAKRMAPIGEAEVLKAFGGRNLRFASQAAELPDAIRQARTGKDVLLLMSSGNFEGMELPALY